MKIMRGKNKRHLNNSFRGFFHVCTAFADAAVDPIDFPIAPAHAVPKVGTKQLLFRKAANFPSTAPSLSVHSCSSTEMK